MAVHGSFTRIVAFGLFTCVSTCVYSAPVVFQFKASDGSTVFSDAPTNSQSMTRTSYKSSYQEKPTVSSSVSVNPCKGLSAADLRHRALSLKATMVAAAAEQNVDVKLVEAVAQVESCFDPKAVSRAGAQGLMQLMPNTAKELGVLNSFDAKQNMRAGAQYLAQMLERFEQNHQLALAAYNAGPGAVEQYKAIPPYPETQAYVQKVLDVYRELTKQAKPSAHPLLQDS